MTNRKNRFNLFKNDKFKIKLKNRRDKNKLKSDKMNDEKTESTNFPSFDSIIPENSPLKNNNSGTSSGFYNDELSFRDSSRNNFNAQNDLDNSYNSDDLDDLNDLDGFDEKYSKYIYSPHSNDLRDFKNNDNEDFNGLKDSENKFFEDNQFKKQDKKNLKDNLLSFKKNLLAKNDASKSLFAKVTILLIFLVLMSSAFYFFVYQPFQSELNLEKNSKLNELNALYKGPLEINSNAYTLENRINQAYDIEEVKSIDVLRSATKDWRIYHSSKIVSCKDDFGRVMMSYGENRNIIMSVKDANDFVKDNDAKILSNVQFNKVNTVIVPVSLSRLQATAGLISVGSVVDIYSLNDNSSEDIDDYQSMDSNMSSVQSNETVFNDTSQKSSLEESGLEESSLKDSTLEKTEEDPIVSGATVLAILRSKDSGLVDSTVSKSKTIIKGNETKPFENTVSYSSDVEELLKSSVLKSSNANDALDSYLMNYGVRLSNFERMSNLGDLDSEYIILLEVPHSDVNFVINNMDNLILTIPTDFAPNWVVNELNETYYDNLYQENSLDFL